MRRLLILLVGLALVLGGCWDRRETNEIAISEALGLDWSDGQYVATLETINARAVPVPGQAPSANPGKPESVFLHAQAPDVAQALANLNSLSSRGIFWPSTDALVIGAGLAAHGTEPVWVALGRITGWPLSARVFIASTSAEALLTGGKPGMEVAIGRNLRLMANNNRRTQSTAPEIRLYDMLREDAEVDRVEVVPGIEPVQPADQANPNYRLSDSAVLRNGTLVAWLKPPQVQMVQWMTGAFVRGTITLTCPGGTGKTSAIRLLHASRQVHPLVTDGHLAAMDLHLQADATADEITCTGLLPQGVAQLAEAQIQAQALALVDWMHQSQDDVLGWGETVFRYNPRFWRQDLAADWPQILSTIPLRLDVSVRVRSTGETRL